MNESFFADKSFTILAAAVAFLVTAIVISIVYRFGAGRRLRLPRNGRARQPRLGVVDAFDLDRQRQLVIVRRDNVEHLLMIGGPNDVVIESEIIRSESRELRSLREAKLRDRNYREPQAQAGAARPSPAEAEAANPLQRIATPHEAEEEREAAPIDSHEEPVRSPAPAIDLPAARSPFFPLPPTRPLAPTPGQRSPVQREPSPGSPEPARKRQAAPSPAASLPRALVATPSLQSSARRKVLGAAVQPAPSPASEPQPEVPPTLGLSSATEAVLSRELEAAAPGSFPALPELAESPARGPPQDEADSARGPVQGTDPLEEEMARLLGRGPG